MFKRIVQAITVLGLTVGMMMSSQESETDLVVQESVTTETQEEYETDLVVHEPVVVETREYTSSPAKYIEVKTMTKSMSIGVSEDDIDLLALVTMAEAEGESELGKRLVISTILNRVDSEYFPDTIEEVIYQANAFSCMTSGRIDRCYVRDDIRQLVKEEILNRTNNEVIFFRAGKYSIYGSPMFSEGNHYFSSYS